MNLQREFPPNSFEFLPVISTLNVSSEELVDGSPLAERFLVSGRNASRDLGWDAGPESAKSYVVGCFDTDPPTPGGMWHWLVVDVPPNVRELTTGEGVGSPTSLGRGLRSDVGVVGYTEAAPPLSGHEHRYVFVLYAEGIEHLNVGNGTSPFLAGFYLTLNSLARGFLTGLA
ncbi:YbhB/YbcL family Raf kinase inhibitor-like protein [Ferrimicrobium sp.]|uniref:YbhB/YbcL family Raf kinase inhibitor-like protein n=1 Tax=Ferrimicrobium sp. TaxID=2926050 RepID=UPI0026135583|nr:YbhB/YbcL family Raf kinase inhibitor-like protein [Ferrimicrobium sp.]